jgi:nitroreductase
MQEDQMTPYQKWYDATFVRRSRRKFDSRALPPDLLAGLEKACADFAPFASVRSVLVGHSPDAVFRGAVGSYGRIKGAAAFIAFIGRTDDPSVNEKLGYMGEGMILEATSLGLATCWVAGLFRAAEAQSLAGAGPDEKVFAVTPVGFSPSRFTLEEKIMTGFGRMHRRRPLSELVSGLGENEWPAGLKPALECARFAPSAINRQPWRFHVEETGVTVSVDSTIVPELGISRRLDCGIAMLHLEIALAAQGTKGKWELLGKPQVARFAFS